MFVLFVQYYNTVLFVVYNSWSVIGFFVYKVWIYWSSYLTRDREENKVNFGREKSARKIPPKASLKRPSKYLEIIYTERIFRKSIIWRIGTGKSDKNDNVES